MKLRAACLAGLLAVSPSARAADPAPSVAVCAVARDPQLVAPSGVLHVLDRAGSSIERWSLATRAALPPIGVGAGAVAFAYLAARDALVIEYGAPARLTLRPLGGRATEQPFVTFSATDGEACGLAASGDLVIACVDHTHYVAFNAAGEETSDLRVGAVPDTTHSWDGMVWVDETRTLYAARKQGTSRSAIALNVDEAGNLGPASVLPIVGGSADLEDEFPVLLPDHSRLLAPDGLVIETAPFTPALVPDVATGEAFSAGDTVFYVGDSLDAGCALLSAETPLASGALLVPGLVRSVSWQGRSWLLRGSGATATLGVVKPGSGDLDSDHSPDSRDFFPFDRVAGRDWDRDGVADKDDALPTNPSDWRDTDGDGVGDLTDVFPDDPNESADSDGDGVGDHADACPDDPDGSVDSDSDGVCDEPGADAFPTDPLEQADSDGDGVGDHGDAFPDDPSRQIAPFGGVTQVFDVDVKRAVYLWGFAPASTTTPMFLVLYDDGRFALQTASSDPPLLGTFARRGASGKKLLLHFEIASLSRLEPEFAAAASAIADAAADPNSPSLGFTPKSVASDGVAQRTVKGVTLSLRVRFAFARDSVTAPAARGSFVYRAKGPAEPQ